MSSPRRPCKKCGLNRQEKFFVSPRGHTCSTCRKRRTKHASRAVRLQETYNITAAEYQTLFARQDGKCAICHGTRPGNLDVDHDHRHEKKLLRMGISPPMAARLSVRGLLCKRCNRRLLPACLDSTKILDSACRYLEEPPASQILEVR